MPSPPTQPDTLRVLGLPVSPLGLEDVVARADEAVADGRTLRVLVTNHNKCRLALGDAALRTAMEEAELVVAESSVVWAARILGREGVAPAWGVVLMERLLDRASSARWSVYLLGATEAVNRTLAERMASRWPGARLVGRHHGYLDASAEAEIRDEVVALAPDLLLVAMGSPRQEHLLARLPVGEGPRVRLGVGGSFDVHAGVKRDAPRWLRGSGFEWLWRAAQDPRLLRRYLVVNPWFVAVVLRERWTGRVPEPRV